MSTLYNYIASNSLFIGFIVLCFAVIILLCIIFYMHKKLNKFLIGIKSENIEDSLNNVSNNLCELKEFRQELEKYLASVEKRLHKSVQSVHTTRFNPFKGSGDGGNQSFATVLLSEDGNGVVISSLYSRDQMRVFSKPIKNHDSEFELSEEEREAIEIAKKLL